MPGLALVPTCCNFTKVICSPLYCPAPQSEVLLQQQQSTGLHSLPLPPCLPPAGPWARRDCHCHHQGTAGHPGTKTTTPPPLTGTACREEGKAETALKHQNKPVKHPLQTYTHLSMQGVLWTTIMLNIRNLKLAPSLLKYLLFFTRMFCML